MSTNQYHPYEPERPAESDLSQIEAYERGLTNDPGSWTQPVGLGEAEVNAYDAWCDAGYRAHCKELGLDPDTGEPPRYAGPTWLAEWEPSIEAGG